MTPPAATLEGRLTQTLIALAGIACVSGQEDGARAYVHQRLVGLGLSPQTDAAGNLMARVAGQPVARDSEAPLLLNAHLDRVPPGKAHAPMLAGGVLRSDGATNLGADDSAGIALLLHVVEELRMRAAEHPPLLLLFTVGEEVGLTGAKAWDPAPWGAQEGIVFDNAGEAGEVVTRAATYVAFDVTLHGSGGHPGKRLEGTASAIEMFHRAAYPVGALDGDTTRVSIGRIEGGTARNAVASEARVLGEARTLRAGQERADLLARIRGAFDEAATSLGGSADVVFDVHCDGYEVDVTEPLLVAYGAARQAQGRALHAITTFIGSDASALRPHTRVFTVSTGAMEEHTVNEWIALAPLAELAETAIALFANYRAAPGA